MRVLHWSHLVDETSNRISCLWQHISKVNCVKSGRPRIKRLRLSIRISEKKSNMMRRKLINYGDLPTA